MIIKTNYSVSKDTLKTIANIEIDIFRESLNEPTGDFFYDPWVIKPKFAGSAIEQALEILPDPIGEARLITLESGTCYFAHSDIDDRYHLNISGDCAALINLETKQSWFLTNDGVWYDMDAGPTHSAASFGQHNRKQIVVRKLLKKNTLLKPKSMTITVGGTNPRFVFDNTISPWLNRANKNKIITNFTKHQNGVSFDIEENSINYLKSIIPQHFNYTIS